MNMLNDLEVGLVPTADFAGRRWFSATPRWYYHRPASAPTLKLDRNFYDLIDPDLRQLCTMLHAAGIPTAPSCQGHFHHQAHFNQVWEELSRERDHIRGGGQVVVDSETRISWLFQNPDYELPWTGFAEFYSQAASHQEEGYLGVRLPRGRWQLWERLLREQHAENHGCFAADTDSTADPWTLHVHVHSPNPDSQCRAWSKAQNHLRSVVRRIDTSQQAAIGLFD